jgi:hypothetical protein
MIHPTFYHRSTDKQIEVQSLEFLSSYYKDDNSFMQVESRFYCIMVRVPASKTIDSEFEPRSGQTKDKEISICCTSAKYAALRIKSKGWLTRNHNSVVSVSLYYTNPI